MSDLLKMYEESKKAHVSEAKQIPSLAVNFFDRQNKFQVGFVTGEKKGDPTKFTVEAQKYYLTEVKNILIPQGFQPTDTGIGLHRYTPDHGYYSPGAKK